MFELTDEQVRALSCSGVAPLRLFNPQTDERYVLLRAEDYARLAADADDYDDSPWTAEELHAVSASTAGRAGRRLTAGGPGAGRR